MDDSILHSRLQRDEPDNEVSRHYSGAVISDGEHLFLQQRDNKPGIVNPGMVTLFGGTTENGENHPQAMVRELREELGAEVTPEDLGFKGWVDKVERDGSVTRCAIYYITIPGVARLVAREGRGYAQGSLKDLLALSKLSAVTRLALEECGSSV